MYTSNGYVYGGKPDIPLAIEKVRVLEDKILILTFNTGETRLFDANVLQGPVFEPLCDEAVFKTASVDHGVVTWLDGEIDCAPEFMYDKSYEYEVAS